jgi:WD40 repeat protein
VIRRDRKVELWDPVTRSRITTLQGRDIATGMNAAFSHDGKRLVTVGHGAKTEHVWDTTTGEKELSFSGGGDAVSIVVFSPDDTLLATGRSDGALRLSDARTGQQVAMLAGHAGAVAAAAFSPDGELVATGADDGTARLWDRHTGRELALFPVADGRVETVAFSPDGRQLATGGTDNRLRIWEIGLPSERFPTVCALAGGGLTRQEWAQYLPGEPYQETCPSPDNS